MEDRRESECKELMYQPARIGVRRPGIIYGSPCLGSLLPLPSGTGAGAAAFLRRTSPSPSALSQLEPQRMWRNGTKLPHTSFHRVSQDRGTVQRGLSLRGLRKLRAQVEQLLSLNLQSRLQEPQGPFPGVRSIHELVTNDFVVKWVRDKAVTGNSRMIDVSSIISEEDVGPPQYFISHAWKSTLGKLMSTVENFLAHASEDTCVWIDCFSVNQHASHPENAADVGAFEEVIKQCTAGTIVVVDMEGGSDPSRRAWCLFEWDHTLLHHGPDGLHMEGLSLEHRARMVASIDVEKAECFFRADKDMILAKIWAHHGSIMQFNNELRLQLLLAPLSYKVDRVRLAERSQGTQWTLGPVEKWLSEGTSRALCILGGAGTGKSSISDAICEQVLHVARHTGHVGAKEQTGVAKEVVIAAAHFLKYSDQRRLDPVSIVKSLVFQFGRRSPEKAQKLLSMDSLKVLNVGVLEDAFEMLLKPLFQEKLGRGHGAVILLDALDEADPVEQQRMQQALVMQKDVDPIQQAKQFSVTACGNKTLRLLLKHMVPGLPDSVRFIITSRPDAVCGGVQATMKRSFQDSITVLDRPGELRGAGSGSGEAEGATLVYRTVVAECNLSQDVLSVPSTAGPLGMLHRAYEEVFDRAQSKVALTQPVRESGYLPLLRVIIAAQEPLSHSLLDQMSLAHLLPSLPGWGFFFYETEHHIYSLHKSLVDWLMLGPRQNPKHSLLDSLHVGHTSLGFHLMNKAMGGRYAIKYLPYHLVEGRGEDSMKMLESVMASWSFIATTFQAGEGSSMIKALGALHNRSPYLEDAYRWLKRCFHEFESTPTVGSMCLATYELQPTVYASKKYNEAAAIVQLPPTVWEMGRHRGGWEAVLSVMQGHVHTVRCVAFSPDGHQLATASEDKTARVWELSTGQEVASFEGHSGAVVSVAFSPNGKQLASGSFDGTARVWELATGQEATCFEGHHGRVSCVAFCPRGKWIATGSLDKTAKVWDLATGQVVASMEGHSVEVTSVAFSPDGKRLATGSWDETARVWDVASSRQVACFRGHSGVVRSVTFSPDGKFVATGSGDKTARIMDLASGKEVVCMEGHSHTVFSVAFSPDGKQLATGSQDETARIWELPSGQEVACLRSHCNTVRGVAFSPDGKRLATGAGDKTACVWELGCSTEVGAPSGETDEGDLPTDLEFSNLVGLIDAQEFEHLEDAAPSALSPDGKLLAKVMEDSKLVVQEGVTGEEVILDGRSGNIHRVAFDPTGNLLAMMSGTGMTRIWEVGGRQVVARMEGSHVRDRITAEVQLHKNEVHSVHLLKAAQNGRVDVVAKFLCQGANLEIKNKDQMTPLYLAAQNGHYDIVSMLQKHGADVNARNKDSSTPLLTAILQGHTKIVDLIISKGGVVDVKDKESISSRLSWAAEKGKNELALLLLKHGADVNARDTDHWTPLHWAADNGHSDIACTLLRHGAEVDSRTADDYTPLDFAAGSGHIDVVNLLLSKGADLHTRDKDHWTPLHWAAYNGHSDVASKLLSHGAEVDSRDVQGSTPLNVAAEYGHYGVVDLLLSEGADVHTRDKDEDTPLFNASRYGRTDVVTLLISKGADLRTRNKEGRTALDDADEKSNEETRAVLRKALALQ